MSVFSCMGIATLGDILFRGAGFVRSAEAEATATYVKDQVNARFPDVRVTRLAQGIPLGAEVKYMDRETLRQSLRYRQVL